MIEKYRNEIDKIDDEIIDLYNKRMEIIKNIAIEKAKNDKNVFDKNREKDIMNRLIKKVTPEIMLFAKQLYGNIFETSKAYQHRFSNINSKVSENIKNVLNEERSKFPTYATVACQGLEGAYSNLASEKLFAISDITYFKDFDGVFTAVERGLCEYGILPIENSSVGSVNAVYDLMKKHNFYIVKSLKLSIRHCLLSKKEVNIKDIKEIYSHDQAINQCNEFIKQLGNIKINICENTATAAKILANSDRSDIACIASKQCADIYNLSILKSNIQDYDNNFTRFICISKNLKIFKNANKISLMINLAHEAGSLYKLLSKFTALGLNLTKLESRPMQKSNFEFTFYFDFEGDIENKEVLNLLAELDNSTEQFVFLGSYEDGI